MEFNELFSADTDRYDTRKVLNRAGSAKIDPEFFVQLKAEGLTSEYLESFPFPVFKYRTQITLHGVFDTPDLIKVGHYQNVIVNENKTIGVKYNAIDYAKKVRLSNYLHTLGWSYQRDSKGDQYTRHFKSLDALKEAYAKADISGFYASKAGLVSKFLGIYALVIYVKALPEKDFWPMFTAISGVSRSEGEQRYAAWEQERQQKKVARDAEYAERERNDTLKKEAAKVVIRTELEPQISQLPTWTGEFADGMVLVRAGFFDYSSGYGFIKQTLSKKGGWFQSIEGKVKQLSEVPSKVAYSSEKKSERTEADLFRVLSMRGANVYKILVNPISDQPTAKSMLTGNQPGNASVTHNVRQNGIEVRFTQRPGDTLLKQLKQMGFQWSSRKSVWYTNYSPSRMATVEKLLPPVTEIVASVALLAPKRKPNPQLLVKRRNDTVVLRQAKLAFKLPRQRRLKAVASVEPTVDVKKDELIYSVDVYNKVHLIAPEGKLMFNLNDDNTVVTSVFVDGEVYPRPVNRGIHSSLANKQTLGNALADKYGDEVITYLRSATSPKAVPVNTPLALRARALKLQLALLSV